jgi:hypothetical protein
MQITTVGLDLAKRVLQVHGDDAVAVSSCGESCNAGRLQHSSLIFRRAWWALRHARHRITGLA